MPLSCSNPPFTLNQVSLATLPAPVRVLVISDIHFGKVSVPAGDLVEQLYAFFDGFSPTSPMTALNLIVFAGDVFDKEQSYSNPAVFAVQQFMREFFLWAKRHEVIVRILEGTPLHDRKQSRNFVPMAGVIEGLDFRYVENMEIEYIEKLGISALYVPDEFGGSAEKAQALIQAEFDRLGIQKVSTAFMHGMFKYQVPEIASDRYKYDEDFFLNKVEGFIHIGHVHEPSQYDRISAQGSFGRLNHGSEVDHGGVMVIYEPGKTPQHFFLKNRKATIFLTIRVTASELEKAVEQIEKKCKELPDFSHVRISAKKNHPVFNVIPEIKKRFGSLHFTKHDNDKKEQVQQFVDSRLLSVDFTPIHLDASNIVDNILGEVARRKELSPYQHQRLTEHLRGLL